jgi:hypothetical protein
MRDWNVDPPTQSPMLCQLHHYSPMNIEAHVTSRIEPALPRLVMLTKDYTKAYVILLPF